MKKILILGGADVHLKLVKAAKEMGVYTIVTDYLKPEDSPCKQIADKSFMLNIFDIDGIVEMCKREKVDGVISTSLDPCQRPYQEICEQLGLPCYCTKEQVYTLTDKNAFKAACVKAGVDIIPTYEIEGLSSSEISKNVKFPVLVKPAHCRGSRGMTICNNVDELPDAVKYAESCSDNNKAIVEKYMGNKDDFTVTYFFINGEAHLIKIADRFLGTVETGMNRNCIASVSASKYTKMYIEKVNSRVVNMLKNLGIKNGPVFFQGFVDGDTVRFYDPGCRFPGASYEIMIKQVLGYDLMKMLVEFALTGAISDSWGIIQEKAYLMNGKAVGDMTPTIRAGVIGKIEGIEEIRHIPGVVYVTVRHKIGDIVGDTHDVNQHICQINIICDTLTEYKKTISKVQNLLHVYDDSGNEMLVSMFQVDRMSEYAFGSD